MAVLYAASASCIAALSAADPPPDSRRTRVVLPSKKPLKWSTGVDPGEYGGPPTTTKLRKYWGGGDKDPVTAMDDFIWNKDFVGHMKRFIGDDQRTPASPPLSLIKQETSSGFLSLNRSMSLDRYSVEIDLTNELRPPIKPVLEQQVEAARRGHSASVNSNSAATPRWRLAPTRREQAKWERASKAATGGSDVIIRESKKVRGDPVVLAAQARKQYFMLKQQLQLLTLGIGGVGLVSTYVAYSPEVAASFGAGFLGSLVYIRMLGTSVDSMANGVGGLLKGAIGQPRLMVPVALVMIYNRWNGILVPDYGLIQLQLIPMLLGFFTYKAATFVQAIEEAFAILNKRGQV